MYKNEFDKRAQNNSLSNSFIFYGENHFLIDRYTAAMSKLEDASVLKLYFDEYSFEGAKAHLSQASLFGEQNLLIIKSYKRIPKKELDALLELCIKNDENRLVYAYYGDEYSAYNKTYEKHPVMDVRFFNPNNAEATQIVAALAKEEALEIDQNAILHLLHAHNYDIALAHNELSKLKIHNRPIGAKEIEQLVFGLGEISIDDLIKKLLEKKDFTDELRLLLEKGENEVHIISTITRYITQLYMFNIYIRVNGYADAAAILGYSPPKIVVDQKASQATRLKLSTFYKLHELLLEAELKMKSSHVDAEAILLSVLLRIRQVL